MSLEAYVAVLEADLDDPLLKNVLLGMANHAGPDGSHCYPSVRRIVAYTNLSESAVRERIQKAQRLELITLVEKSKRHKPNEYRMNVGMLKEMKHQTIIDLDGEGPIYGGGKTPATRRSKKSKTPAGRDETSAKDNVDLRPVESSPPPDGPEPSLEPSKETSINPKAEISNDQTPLAMALASIRMEFTNGNMYSKPGPIFDQVYKPLKAAGLLQTPEMITMNLTHPDPGIFDKQTEAMLRQAFVSIFGGEVEIKIMEEQDV